MNQDTAPTSGAADRTIENCPELNMGNYDEVEVERLNDWAIRANDEIDRLHALAAGQAAEPSITLDFKMATDLLGMFCGEPGLVTLQRGDEHCHSGPGLYAWYSDMPEEGAGFLGAEPDDEATPSAPSAPAQPVAAAADCSAGQPCSTCPNKKACQRGCIRQSEFISTEYHAAQADSTRLDNK